MFVGSNNGRRMQGHSTMLRRELWLKFLRRCISTLLFKIEGQKNTGKVQTSSFETENSRL
jgi:hypothetical protein